MAIIELKLNLTDEEKKVAQLFSNQPLTSWLVHYNNFGLDHYSLIIGTDNQEINDSLKNSRDKREIAVFKYANHMVPDHYTGELRREYVAHIAACDQITAAQVKREEPTGTYYDLTMAQYEMLFLLRYGLIPDKTWYKEQIIIRSINQYEEHYPIMALGQLHKLLEDYLIMRPEELEEQKQITKCMVAYYRDLYKRVQSTL